MSSFSKKIRELRMSKNISQKQIANCLNINDRQYRRYENEEQQPTLSVVIDIANYFNVPLDYLTGRGLYSKEEDIIKYKTEIITLLNKFFKTDFFDEISNFSNIDFIHILASLIKDINFNIDDENNPIIKLYPLLPSTAGTELTKISKYIQ